MRGTNADSAKNQLELILRTCQIDQGCVGYVYDVGSNLSSCSETVNSVVSCDVLGLTFPLKTSCWAHILITFLSKSISPDAKHDIDLSLLSFKYMKRRLQICITWTTKIGKGATAWEGACTKSCFTHKKLYTPVKTRFSSVLLMLYRLVKYRKSIELTYICADSPELWKRNPTLSEWAVAEVVHEELIPLTNAC